MGAVLPEHDHNIVSTSDIVLYDQRPSKVRRYRDSSLSNNGNGSRFLYQARIGLFVLQTPERSNFGLQPHEHSEQRSSVAGEERRVGECGDGRTLNYVQNVTNENSDVRNGEDSYPGVRPVIVDSRQEGVSRELVLSKQAIRSVIDK